MMRGVVLGILCGAAAWLAPSHARAFEREWHVGGGVGITAYPHHYSAGPSLGLNAAYGISDVFDLKLELGSAFTFKTQAYPGWDGTVNCRVVEIEAYREISYTWSVPFLDTVVTFTLKPTATGTHLSLVQSGFKSDQKREFGGARYGWNMMGGKLVDLLARMP